jgi:RNA polymerase sigma factor (sigma-70 family)
MEGGSALAEAGDDELLVAVAAGDREAFAALYVRHAVAVYRFCLARLRDREAAADACQETFAAVWLGARGYAGTGPVLAWMLGIARHKVAAAWRRAAARREVAWGGPGTGGPCEASTEAAVPDGTDPVEEAADVWRALGRLPEGQREAVLLTYGLGLSCEEAGVALGVPAGTVKSRLHAARRALARELGGPGAGAGGHREGRY